MRPLELELRNCLSFRHARLDFRPLRGLVLLAGENRDSACQNGNGAGKSGLLAALVWTLYGKLPCLSYRADEVVHTQAGHDCEARLVFLDVDGREVVVHRTRKHREHGDGVTLSIDGRRVTGSARSLQVRIDALVGAGADTFLGACVYTQHPLRGRFLDIGDTERKLLLDSILGVDALGRARELVRHDLRSTSRDLAGAEAELARLGERLAWLDAQRTTYGARAAEWDRARASRLGALDARVLELRRQLDDLGPVTEPAVDPARLEAALRAATANLDAVSRDTERSDRAFEARASELRAEISRQAALAGRLRKDIDQLSGLAGSCPLCRHPIDPAHRAAHVAILEAELETHRRAERDGREALDALLAERADANARGRGARQDREQEVTRLRAAMEREQQAAARRRERETLAAEIARIEAERCSVADEPNRFAELLAEVEAELVERTAARTVAETLVAGLRTDAGRLEFWDKGFGPKGLSAYLLDAVLPQLNERAAHFAAMLTGGEIAVSFSLAAQKGERQDDRLELEVRHRSGVTNPWLLAGGMRQRLNLVLSLALQDLAARRARHPLRVAFYDEAFESLDTVGVETVVRVLHEAARSRELVLVVTHQPALQDLFAHRITVVYEHGESRIEVGA